MVVLSTLAELLPGESGTIREDQPDYLPQRLLDLGFIPGGEVQCLFRSPAGEPCAYLVRATIVALRREDSQRILVEKGAKK